MNNIVWTAVVTPFSEDGRLHTGDLETLLRRQEHAGNGIVILGSTGESLNLNETERKAVVDFTCSLNLSVPVLCGVGGHDLEGTLRWLQYLETMPVDGYLMVTPIYSKPGTAGQYQWFSALMNAVSRPCMLYNVPSRSGTSLSIEALIQLRDHPNFWAVKEASGSTERFAAYVKAANGAPVYSGDDARTPDYAPLGAAGVVSVSANIWPEATREITRRALAHELTSEEISLWREASDSLFIASNPVPVKALLAMEGIISSGAVKLPLSADDLTITEPLTRSSRRINAWFEEKAAVAA